MDDRTKDQVAMLLMGITAFSRHLDRVSELVKLRPGVDVQQSLQSFFRGLVVQPAMLLQDTTDK